MADSLNSSVSEDNDSLDGYYGNGRHALDYGNVPQFAGLTRSDSNTRRKSVVRACPDTEDLLNLLHGSDPVKVELNRLENEVRDKDRKLAEATAECKVLKQRERLREKAVEELAEELDKVDEKLKAAEDLLESKNLELKKLNDEKKAALAAQFAAEATLRRVHAAQKDEQLPSIEEILSPLEAELKIARQEIAKLQDTNRALDRLTKSKEAALLEIERAIDAAEAKASQVDDLLNRNQELMKQIEICQEENKIMDKMHRQKTAEIEKLSSTVAELEEAVLAGGAAVNAARDYQRQAHELLEGKKTLERELARAKITANRVAVVVANEWKDANDKVMPVKQWLDERRFMQGEMQQLRDKLASAERTAKNESQLKDKFQMRLKVLEESLKPVTNGAPRRTEEVRSSSTTRRSTSGSEEASKLLANGSRRQRSAVTQVRASMASQTLMRATNGRMTSKSFDGGRSLDAGTTRLRAFSNGFEEVRTGRRIPVAAEPEPVSTTQKAETGAVKPDSVEAKSEVEAVKSENGTTNQVSGSSSSVEDPVSGVLYDLLQKEVVNLRKASYEKDQSLKDKDDAIEMLSKKVDTLSKALEVEGKKMRREVQAMEKEVATLRAEKDQTRNPRRLSSGTGTVNSSSKLLSGRNGERPMVRS
ncbi:microtubule-associated protein 70-3 [Physcomitrium patens]|uniref:Uncharacterized protein n=1 Tax=Physcomitrium patens TaxID=3218 RepID=A0A2K1KA27_PHYPA|nr:microtubule-associated protein 70-1-like [Physcomitrium patens]PNR50621.1 hypothetical protein PHYPA_009807 [Physcomitrium patens]|eukprot:XP_024381202.1 microtubule-associated protein 70-1-like [Physcomitrella patens]